VSAAAQITGGKGGGKPELGQGGGVDTSKIQEAFLKIKELL
jgi:alanyl-tRNA synthetase